MPSIFKGWAVGQFRRISNEDCGANDIIDIQFKKDLFYGPIFYFSSRESLRSQLSILLSRDRAKLAAVFNVFIAGLFSAWYTSTLKRSVLIPVYSPKFWSNQKANCSPNRSSSATRVPDNLTKHYEIFQAQLLYFWRRNKIFIHLCSTVSGD